MRVRPARNLPFSLFNPTVLLVNLFPDCHNRSTERPMLAPCTLREEES